MSTREVTAIAIKLLAIWLLVHVVLYLPSVSTLFSSLQQYNQEELPKNMFLAIVVCFLVVGVIVAMLMVRLSNAVLDSVPSKSENSNLSEPFILQIAGVFFIVSALSALPGAVLGVSQQSSISNATYGYIAGHGIELVVGLYLLVKPKVWVLWLNKFRGRT